MTEECGFCKKFGISADGFICNKDGRKVDRNDTCNDFEVVE